MALAAIRRAGCSANSFAVDNLTSCSCKSGVSVEVRPGSAHVASCVMECIEGTNASGRRRFGRLPGSTKACALQVVRNSAIQVSVPRGVAVRPIAVAGSAFRHRLAIALPTSTIRRRNGSRATAIAIQTSDGLGTLLRSSRVGLRLICLGSVKRRIITPAGTNECAMGVGVRSGDPGLVSTVISKNAFRVHGGTTPVIPATSLCPLAVGGTAILVRRSNRRVRTKEGRVNSLITGIPRGTDMAIACVDRDSTVTFSR